MGDNTFGKLFSFTTWGESHGKAIGVVVDGVPSGIELSEEDIQIDLNRRRPGQSAFTTQRKESDTIEILSGVFQGKTTGTPISMIVYNEDQRSRDYTEISKLFRPGHSDYVYYKKYGPNRDYRGGGRSSARETAMRVAAGAIARKVILRENIKVQGALVQIGNKKINRDNWNWDEVNKNPFFSADPEIVDSWAEYIDTTRKAGSSVGAVIEVVASGVPVGLGMPIYGKLDAELANAMMSINAVKAVEIGNGFAGAELHGENNSDAMKIGKDGQAEFVSNNAGGIIGGISSGADIVVRFAVKPTSSITIPKKSVNIEGDEVDVVTKGRHDPCVGIRAVPIGEAMMANVLADHLLRYLPYKLDL